MLQTLSQRLRECVDLHAALECALAESLELSDTRLGNIQLIDWNAGYLTIEAQHGFDEEFLNCFARVTASDGTACGRVLRTREAVLVDDVMLDSDFTPFRDVACRAGFRSVQSLPLVSTSGALVGVLSAHFAKPRPVSNRATHVLEQVARTTADAIIGHRARVQACDGWPLEEARLRTEAIAAATMFRVRQAHTAVMDSDELLRRSWRTIERSRALLASSALAPAFKLRADKGGITETPCS